MVQFSITLILPGINQTLKIYGFIDFNHIEFIHDDSKKKIKNKIHKMKNENKPKNAETGTLIIR